MILTRLRKVNMSVKQILTLVFTLLIFGLFNSSFAQTDFNALEELFLEQYKKYDFSDINVIVENLNEQAKKSGLTTQQIQNDAEIRLQKAGLRINKNAKQYIYINLNSINTDGYSLAYSIDVSLKQDAVLTRDKSVSSTATTWNNGLIGITSVSNIRTIRDSISDFIDEFVNNYLKYQNQIRDKKNVKPSNSESTSPIEKTSNTSQSKSPFIATYIGGNREPEVEIFNDTNRTLYIDLGQGKMTAHAIPTKQSKAIQLIEGVYSYKATAARVSPLQGNENFKRGYRYTWRFVIVASKR